MIDSGRDIIRAGYAAGKSVADIARECDSTPGSVRVIAHKMGLRHPYMVARNIPRRLLADYRTLVSLGRYAAPEAAAILGVEVAGP
jgi:hypothetical protein